MSRICIVLIAGLLIMQACGGVKRVEKKPRLTTTPERLNLAVNQKTDPYMVPVNYVLNIPRGYVPSCARLVYSPRFVAPGHEYVLPPVVVTGKNYNRLDERQQLLDGKAPAYTDALHLVAEGDSMRVSVSEQVPFQVWMPGAKLRAEVSLESCGKETALYSQDLADGVYYMPESPGPVLVKYIQKEVQKKAEGFARFYYPVNGYKVDPALYNNKQQLDSMNKLILRIINDTSMRMDRIVITGICSPDGPWSYNEELARKRAEYISYYLNTQVGIDARLIEVKYIAEDWEGLARLVAESSLNNKEAVLDIIRHTSDPEQREAALRRLPQFAYIKQNFYPQLRKVTYEVFYTIKESVQEVVPE